MRDSRLSARQADNDRLVGPLLLKWFVRGAVRDVPQHLAAFRSFGQCRASGRRSNAGPAQPGAEAYVTHVKTFRRFQACRKSSCWMASTVLARGFGLRA